MPRFGAESGQEQSRPQQQRAAKHGEARPDPVDQGARHGSDEPVDQHVHGKHSGGGVPGPIEFVEKGRKDDRERITGAVAEGIGDDAGGDDQPAVEKERASLHLHSSSLTIQERHRGRNGPEQNATYMNRKSPQISEVNTDKTTPCMMFPRTSWRLCVRHSVRARNAPPNQSP
jgi:hypothetical protein